MPAPILFGTLALAAFFVACSREDKAAPRATPTPKSLKNNQPTTCQGKRYDIPFKKDSLSLCHLDTNGDDVFQKSNDKLLFLIGKEWQPVHRGKAFARHPLSKNLPQFEMLNLKDWAEIQNYVFKGGARQETTEQRLSGIIEFAKHNNLDLNKLKELAAANKLSQERGQLDPVNRINALALSALLLQLKRPANAPFYKKYRPLIDKITRYVAAKKLTLKDESQKSSSAGINHMASALYDWDLNQLVRFTHLKQGPLSLIEQSLMLHELVHFHQDLTAQKISEVDAEVFAYLVQADFILMSKNYPELANSESELEAFIAKLKKSEDIKKKELVLDFALWAIFYKLQGNKKKEQENVTRMRELLIENGTRRYVMVAKQIVEGRSGAPKPLREFLQDSKLSPQSSREEFLLKLESYISERAAQRQRLLDQLRATPENQSYPEALANQFMEESAALVFLKTLQFARTNQASIGDPQFASLVEKEEESHRQQLIQELMDLKFMSRSRMHSEPIPHP